MSFTVSCARGCVHVHMVVALVALVALGTHAVANPPPRHIQCAETEYGLDYAYGDLRMIQAANSAACCSACAKEPLCVLWVKDTGNSTSGNSTVHDCFLKKTWSDIPCSHVRGGQPCRRTLAGRESMAPGGPAPTPSPPPPPPPPPPPAPVPKHFLPVYELSVRYRNWTYYTGGPFNGFVVPPTAGNFTGQVQTDTAVVFEKTPEDTLSGKYRMWYLYWDSIKGQQGYQTALATSDDLVSWKFNEGGDNGIILKRNPLPGSYDYGGVTMGCGFWASSNISSRRLLRDNQKMATSQSTRRQLPAHKYYALYGCYPTYGMEAGDGGQGVAWSDDGVTWHRESPTVGALSGGKSTGAAKWESHVVYQPNVVVDGEMVYDFYNAAGVNEYGENAEETGFATLPLSKIPGIDHTHNESLWHRDPRSPVIASGPSGSCDSRMASDPKVFWDEEQQVYVMFYFGCGDGTHGKCDIMIAFSKDLIKWDRDERPLYRAGGHPNGIDANFAHKVSVIYDQDTGVGYMYYTAVSYKYGRGIALLTSKPVETL